MEGRWPKQLKDQILPARLAEPEKVEINVLWQGKSYPTPAVLSQKEDGNWYVRFSFPCCPIATHE